MYQNQSPPFLNESKTYSLREFAQLTGKSQALLYRRLTEKASRYKVRFARREGDRWVFDRQSVDDAIAAGESLIIRESSTVDQKVVFNYIKDRFRSCGKDTI